MNRFASYEQNAMAGFEGMKMVDSVVCPKPRRLSALNPSLNDSIRPPYRCFKYVSCSLPYKAYRFGFLTWQYQSFWFVFANMFLVFCCLNSQYQSEVGDSQAASELLDLILNKVTLFFSSQIFFISIISILFFCIISISCSTKFYIFTPSTSSTNRSFFVLFKFMNYRGKVEVRDPWSNWLHRHRSFVGLRRAGRRTRSSKMSSLGAVRWDLFRRRRGATEAVSGWNPGTSRLRCASKGLIVLAGTAGTAASLL